MKWYRFTGYALTFIAAAFIGIATTWYVAPCVALMIIGNELVEKSRGSDK